LDTGQWKYREDGGTPNSVVVMKSGNVELAESETRERERERERERDEKCILDSQKER
jgi:hypothetical protein